MRKFLSKITGCLSEVVLTIFQLCGCVFAISIKFAMTVIALLIIGPFVIIHDCIKNSKSLSDVTEEYIKSLFRRTKEN